MRLKRTINSNKHPNKECRAESYCLGIADDMDEIAGWYRKVLGKHADIHRIWAKIFQLAPKYTMAQLTALYKKRLRRMVEQHVQFYGDTYGIISPSSRRHKQMVRRMKNEILALAKDSTPRRNSHEQQNKRSH